MGGLLITVMALYAAPRRRTGQGRGPEGSGLYPELAAFRISEGSSPNVQSQTGRLVGLLPIATAQAELSRHGLDLDKKAVHRIASELGLQMLATRTRDLLRYRQGELPAGAELSGKRVAVQIDGGRIRIVNVRRTPGLDLDGLEREVRADWPVSFSGGGLAGGKPAVGEEFVEAVGGVGADGVEDVAKVGVRIEAESFAGGGDREDGRGGAAAGVRSGKQPILSIMLSSA